MEYKRFGSKILVRIDKDEEILEKVKELALKEKIRLAAVQALGATNSFTVGVYNVAEKKYYANTFSGSFEIVSLTGTINTIVDQEGGQSVIFYQVDLELTDLQSHKKLWMGDKKIKKFVSQDSVKL